MADFSIMPCTQLKGVGAKVAERLAKLGINTVADLLWHLPLRYQDQTKISPIRSLVVGQHGLIEAKVVSSQIQFGKKRSYLVHLQDESGLMQIRFFYFNAKQQQLFSQGNVRVRCFGQVSITRQGLSMVHPEYQIIHDNETPPLEKFYTPIYPTTDGLKQGMWRKLFGQILNRLDSAVGLQDFIPASLLEQQQLPDLITALKTVHLPPADISIEKLNLFQHPTQRRLALEELLAHQLSLQRSYQQWVVGDAIALTTPKDLQEKFSAQLPFSLTNAQQRVLAEIQQHLQSNTPMLRLLQGDVGSGKTVVAAMAALGALAAGKQVALMAPTEILAEQHFVNFKKWLEPLGFTVTLLTGSLKKKERDVRQAAIVAGQTQVIIGTQALIQTAVAYQQLALVIIDEQHRFGVHQRLQLREKNSQTMPHQLIMTATPIPRTLAMTLFADMPISVIDERPPGRKPIKTVAIVNSRRSEVIQRIQTACTQGRQVYWICTLVEESEHLDAQDAEATFETLSAVLPQTRIAIVHGRMTSEQKDQALSAFRQHEYDVLVATTVVEVGVDVPNASLMVIENPERLGLSQLHQLRGRVGRGDTASFCVLLYQSPLNEYAKQRLDILRQSDDGFVIAQKDLELRGPGEVLGTRQAGEVGLKVADLGRDQDLLPIVQQLAQTVQASAPQYVEPIIQRWLGSKSQFAVV